MSDTPFTPDEQDAKLSLSGDKSLYQRIRLLTHEERANLDKLLAGGDIADFLTKSGKPKKALRELQEKVPCIMDRLGLTDEYLIEKCLKPLLEANDTKFFADKGIVTDEREVEDNSIRRQALDMAFKLRGTYGDAESDSHRYGDINVHIVNVGA